MPELAKPQVRIRPSNGRSTTTAIVKNIVPNKYEVQQGFLPKGLPGALTDHPFKKDVAKAKALMKDAGLAERFQAVNDGLQLRSPQR